MLIITVEKTEVNKIFFSLESGLIFLSRGFVYNREEEMKEIISNLTTLPKQWCFFCSKDLHEHFLKKKEKKPYHFHIPPNSKNLTT